jgi:hypothetical protein
MELLTRVAVVAALIGSGACERPPTDMDLSGDGLLAAFAVFEAGRAEGSIVVAWSDRASAPPAAQVLLTHNGATLVLEPGVGSCTTFNQPNARCYATPLAAPLAATDVLRVSVAAAGFATIEGQTIIPAAPTIASPVADARIVATCVTDDCESSAFGPPVAQLPVDVSSELAAGLLEAVLRITTAWAGNVRLDAECIADHPPLLRELPGQIATTLPIRTLRCFAGGATVRWDSLSAELKAIAYDADYADYHRRVLHGDALRPEAGSFGLTSGFGVLAAAGTARRTFTVVR